MSMEPLASNLKGKTVEQIVRDSNGHFDGATAFYLHSTHGLHIDTLAFFCERKGWKVDREDFDRVMAEERQKTRERMQQD